MCDSSGIRELLMVRFDRGVYRHGNRFPSGQSFLCRRQGIIITLFRRTPFDFNIDSGGQLFEGLPGKRTENVRCSVVVPYNSGEV